MAAAPATAQSPAAADPPPAEPLVAAALRAWNVPGVAVAVVRRHDTLLLKGFGVRRRGHPAPVTPDTLFPLASCTKAFTTTLLATLADDGLLDWDDPVRKHYRGFRLSDPHADALLTVRDLLCHRCGLGGHDLLWYRAPWGTDEVLKRAATLPLDYPFRSGYRYTSIPYLAAGRVCEAVGGRPWEQLVHRRLCEPLGMTATVFTTPPPSADVERATSHRLAQDGHPEPTPTYELTEPNPAGSIHSTARDLARWLRFHLAGGLTPSGHRIVSARNLAETHTPQVVIRLEGPARELNPETVQLSYGLGWLVYDYRGKKVLSHGGLVDGFRVQLTLLPDDDLGIAVLANLHDTRLPAALTNTLIDHYCHLPGRDWTAYYQRVTEAEAARQAAARAARERSRDPQRRPSLPAADFAGEYLHPAYGTATVTHSNGRLELAWSSFRCPLEHFTADTFRICDGFFADQLVAFVITEGRPVTLSFVGQRFERK